MPLDVQIRPIPAYATAQIRRDVLWPTVPLESQLYEYDFAKGTVHLGAFTEGGIDPVAVGTIVRAPFARPDALAPDEAGLPAAQLRKLAVVADLQGQGVGSAMMAHAAQLLTPSAPGSAVLLHFDARAAQAAFYEKLGYRVLDPTPFTKSFGGEEVAYVRMGKVLRAAERADAENHAIEL